MVRILWFAFVLTASTSLVSGIVFTLLGEAIKREVGDEAGAAGWLGSSNTAGAMCGSLLAIFVVVPLWGIERGFFIVSVSYAVVGLLALPDSGGQRRAKVAFSIAAAAWSLALITFPFGLMRQTFLERTVGTQETGAHRLPGKLKTKR